MAVAMEVGAKSWRGGTSELLVRKKRAWGADAQQLMQLMMGQQGQQGQLQHSDNIVKPAVTELTLDLLGKADPACTAAVAPKLCSECPEFLLHLDPEDSAPLPSGWEKCLDLQTGKLYYVNKTSGVSSFNDPRKQQIFRNHVQPEEVELQTQVDVPILAHEFLSSKKSETLKQQESMKASSSSSSGSPRPISTRAPPSFPTNNNKLWNLQRNNINNNSSTSAITITPVEDDSSNLELDLNLASCRSTQPSVCTMEMIQNALKRSGEPRILRDSTTPRSLRLLKASVSSTSFSSLTNSATTARSEPSGGASPSTSSSSTSASSRSSSLLGAGTCAPASNAPSTTGVCEAESIKVENSNTTTTTVEPGSLVMGACTRCLMYVMLNKADPRCPRCDSKVPVDFSSAAAAARPSKKQRAAAGGSSLKLGFGSSR